MGAAARQDYLDRFTSRRMNERLVQLYREVLQGVPQAS